VLDESLHPLLFHQVILILSQSLRLFCDPVAAVLESAACSHTATSLENLREAAIAACPSLPPW